MADAAQRAREASSGEPSPAATVPPTGSQPAAAAISGSPTVGGEGSFEEASGAEPIDDDLATGAFAGGEPRRPSRRRLGRAAEAGIAVGLVIAVVLIALNAGGGSTSSRSRAVARANSHPSTRLETPPAAPAPRPLAPPTAMPPLPPPGGGPQLSSITPPQGTAGQVVVVAGAGLISSDGQIVANFNGQAAPTRCPNSTSCTVTVPDIGVPPSMVTVTVTTAQGTSNALPFSYG